MERGTGFEPAHPRVEALVHLLFYVTPARIAQKMPSYGIEFPRKVNTKLAFMAKIPILSRVTFDYGHAIDHRRDTLGSRGKPRHLGQRSVSQEEKRNTCKVSRF